MQEDDDFDHPLPPRKVYGDPSPDTGTIVVLLIVMVLVVVWLIKRG